MGVLISALPISQDCTQNAVTSLKTVRLSGDSGRVKIVLHSYPRWRKWSKSWCQSWPSSLICRKVAPFFQLSVGWSRVWQWYRAIPHSSLPPLPIQPFPMDKAFSLPLQPHLSFLPWLKSPLLSPNDFGAWTCTLPQSWAASSPFSRLWWPELSFQGAHLTMLCPLRMLYQTTCCRKEGHTQKGNWRKPGGWISYRSMSRELGKGCSCGQGAACQKL